MTAVPGVCEGSADGDVYSMQRNTVGYWGSLKNIISIRDRSLSATREDGLMECSPSFTQKEVVDILEALPPHMFRPVLSCAVKCIAETQWTFSQL